MHQPHDLLIDTRDLTWSYPNSPMMIFHNFNFALYKNDFCIVTGRAGSGKSTLVKLIIRQYNIQNKMIFYKNEDLSRLNEHEVQEFRRKVWIVFQDYKLIERKTVLENIVYPLSILQAPPMHKSIKLKKIIELVWLQKQQNIITRYLSGGEKQKVAIARALVHSPEFIIADEPTGNLDPESTKQIADILIQMHKLWNTILLITHNQWLRDYINSQVSTTIKEL